MPAMQPDPAHPPQPAPGRGSAARCLAGLALVAGAAGVLAEDFTYVVQPGDNPWNITRRYLKSIDYWPRIQDYNRILEPRTIQPGTRLRIPVAWMRAEPGAARVVDLRGGAELQRGGQITPLRPGMSVPAGSILRTRDEASLLLEFPDGSRSLIGADAEVRVAAVDRLLASSAQQVRLEVARGHLDNEVRSRRGGGRYTIHTPAAVAAVRGTTFRVAAMGDRVRTETLGGEVALGNRAGTTRLPAGTGTQARAGEAPGPATELLPAPDVAALPERIERLPFSLAFPPVAGATAYRTRIAPRSGFTAIESDLVAPAPIARGKAALADGSYRMRVRAIDAAGLEGIDAEREIVVDARPEPPFLQTPAPDAFVVDEKPAFGWARSSEPAHYRLQIGIDADFRAPLYDETRLEEPGFTAGEALPPGRYFWRVAMSTATEGQGPFSDVQTFRRPPPGPAPEPPQVDGDTLTLRWRAAGEQDRYQVQMSADRSFAAPTLDVETDEPALAIAAPAPGVHHLRIRTLEPGNPPGPWGKSQQVEVPYSHWRALLVFLPLLLLAI